MYLSPEYFEKIFIRLCVIGKFYVSLHSLVPEGLKGNRVRILNSPAAVISLYAVSYTSHCRKMGRRSRQE